MAPSIEPVVWPAASAVADNDNNTAAMARRAGVQATSVLALIRAIPSPSILLARRPAAARRRLDASKRRRRETPPQSVAYIPRHATIIQIRVTVGVPIGAHLLSRLDAVAGDRGLDRADALHAALLCWLEQAERTTAVRDRMRMIRALTKTDVRPA